MIWAVLIPGDKLIYSHIFFYCASLCWGSQIMNFIQIEGLWQPCMKQIYWHHFSNSIFSYHVSVWHRDTRISLAIFQILIIIVYIFMKICDLWCYYCHCFGTSQTVLRTLINHFIVRILIFICWRYFKYYSSLMISFI